jgi:hypothetical protein
MRQIFRGLDIGLALDRLDPRAGDPIDVLDDVIGELRQG